jgi:hypothetical protein
MNERADARPIGDRAVIDLMLAHVPSTKSKGLQPRGVHGEAPRNSQDWANLNHGWPPPPPTS